MAISSTMVPRIAASASQFTNDSGSSGATWPLTTTNSWFTARWVTGTPAWAGTATALVTPGTTVTGIPASAQASTFFVPAREHERVAALETHHELARRGAVDHQRVDGVLGHRPPVRDLGGVDDLDVRRQFGEQFRRREPVGHHDVGVRKHAAAAHGDQLRSPGPPPTSATPPRTTSEVASASKVIVPSCNASRIADRIAAERLCSPPARTPTDRPA